MDLKWFCAVMICVASAGCSNNDLVLKKQTEMEARLEQLVQANSGINVRLAELTNEVKGLQDQVKGDSAELGELKSSHRELKSALEETSQPLGKEPKSAPPKIVVVNKGGVAGEGVSAEQDAYLKAFGLFSVNDYKGAIDSFQSFIKAYPGSEYAGNAQYWIGECYYTQREFTHAIEAFTKVVEAYPNGKKVPDAMLKVGYSHISMNQRDEARGALEALVEKFPKSPAAVKARERLSRN